MSISLVLDNLAWHARLLPRVIGKCIQSLAFNVTFPYHMTTSYKRQYAIVYYYIDIVSTVVKSNNVNTIMFRVEKC